MNFGWLDWSAIIAYLVITLVLGLWFRRRSGKSIDDYFVSGRNVNWWLAGTSMVATTFAADTPLLVTGLVYAQGVSGNWLWWGMLLSGMMTVFLFARLWRRSGLLTDVQFAELRYAGKPAAFLRGFRAVYLGLLMNCLILGWVTKAMVSIVGTTFAGTPLLHKFASVFGGLGPAFRGDEGAALAVCVFVLIPFTGLYVSLGGLWGVLWTDLFQFVLKMSIVIVIGYYAVGAAGGMHGMLAALAQKHAANPGSADPLNFFPDFTRAIAGQPLWMVPVVTFLVNIGLQWWASWYPGAEPGGGGYIAQRIFSSRDEKQGLLSVLWFNFAHYAIRPWPWVVTALAVIVLYPNLGQPGQPAPEAGYMLALNRQCPHWFIGIAMAGFLAAFMSTIATQLNWGASYLVADFYRRFLVKEATQAHYVNISRLITVILVIASAWISVQLTSIQGGWQAVLEVGAGTGAVYLLRWYWWRINAWSEISAMAVAAGMTVVLHLTKPFAGNGSVVFAKTAITTAVVTSIAWIVVTLITPPEDGAVLERFYRKVRPDVRGWKAVAAKAGDVPPTRDLGHNLWAWVLGCAMVYLALFGTGKLLFLQPVPGIVMLVLSAGAGFLLYRGVVRNFSVEPMSEFDDAPIEPALKGMH